MVRGQQEGGQEGTTRQSAAEGGLRAAGGTIRSLLHSLFPPSKLAFSDGGGGTLVVVEAAVSRVRAKAMAAVSRGCAGSDAALKLSAEAQAAAAAPRARGAGATATADQSCQPGGTMRMHNVCTVLYCNTLHFKYCGVI
eukprot:COSAG01_NODE_4519_length_4959_cov_35.814815_5_plen_139_part_00